jgi:hypothetical protein
MLAIDCMLMFGSGAAAAFALSVLTSDVSEQMRLVVGACASAIVVLVILIERLSYHEEDDTGVLRAILRTGPDAGQAALLAAHPLLAQGILIDAAQVDDLPRSTLESLAFNPMITPNSFANDPVMADAGRNLLDRFSASHLLRLSNSPPRFLAVAAGDFSDEEVDDELMAAAYLLKAAT